MKKTTSIVLTAMMLFSVLTCGLIAFDVSAQREAPLLYDGADLLSDAEKASISDTLESIAQLQSFDVAICTVDQLPDGYSEDISGVEAFADDYFDFNGFGFGSGRDGCVLVLDMAIRKYWISTRGFGITALTDAGISYIGEEIRAAGLSDEDYAGAFRRYADLCSDFIARAKNGEPFDGSVELTKEEKVTVIAASVAGGIVIAAIISFIVMAIMKSRLRSVYSATEADAYLADDSVNITGRSDVYLYSHITKVAKPKQSSGGSSTHTSSSGASHGGGGGSF